MYITRISIRYDAQICRLLAVIAVQDAVLYLTGFRKSTFSPDVIIITDSVVHTAFGFTDIASRVRGSQRP